MPRLDFKCAITEYWSVSEENMDRWQYFYDNVFLAAITHCDGYAGTIVKVRSEDLMRRTLGTPPGPRRVISPHPFLSQLGVRTDAMIDFDALLQHEYNIVAVHLLDDVTSIETLFPQWVEGYKKVQPNWQAEHPGAETVEDAVMQDYFSLVDNHWDVFYEVTKVFWNEGPMGPVAPPR